MPGVCVRGAFGRCVLPSVVCLHTVLCASFPCARSAGRSGSSGSGARSEQATSSAMAGLRLPCPGGDAFGALLAYSVAGFPSDGLVLAGLRMLPGSSEPERTLRPPGTAGRRGSRGVAPYLERVSFPLGVANSGKWQRASLFGGAIGRLRHSYAWTSRFRRSLNPVRFRAAGPSTCRWVPGRTS